MGFWEDIKRNSGLIVFIVVGITIAFAAHRYGAETHMNLSVSYLPPMQDYGNDWFMTASKTIEPVTYEVTRIFETLDGDTFKADLSRNGKAELKGVKVRLAGINSPERFDQNCWKEARDFVKEWFAKPGKIFVQSWGADVYGNRPVGFVYRSNPYQSLEQELVKKGLALPCLGYLKGKVSKEKYENHKKAILQAASYAMGNIKPDVPSVWGMPEKKLSILVEANTKKDNPSRDRIVIKLDNPADTLDLSGYSIMDESSTPQQRFFLPKVVLSSTKNTVTIFTGQKDNSGWVSANGDIYVLSGSDWINDDGDTLYLRDSQRKVISYQLCYPK